MLKTTDKSLYRRVGATDIVAAQAQASVSALHTARSLSHKYGDFDRLNRCTCGSKRNGYTNVLKGKS